MFSRIIVRNLALSTVIAGISWLGSAAQSTSASNTQAGTAQSGKVSPADKLFMRKAARGGKAEVELGKLAQEKASSPEVKQFGQRMVTDHSKANEKLQSVASSKGVDLPKEPGLTAMLMSNHPHAVALFFALSSLSLPVVIFPADARAWRSSPSLPAGTPVFVPPGRSALAAAGTAAGLSTFALPDERPAGAAGAVWFLACPGFVNFTSGSTGLPKPVYIATRSFLVQTAAVIEAGRLAPGAPVVGSLQLSTHYGLGQALILSTVLGSPLGLLERFDHRSLLRLLATGSYAYWAATPSMADVLARAPLPAPRPDAPAICHISAGRLSAVSKSITPGFITRPRCCADSTGGSSGSRCAARCGTCSGPMPPKR